MEDTQTLKSSVIKSVYDYCIKNSLTPYITVRYSEILSDIKPYFEDNIVTLNLGSNSTLNLKINAGYISFSVTFNTVPIFLHVPIKDIICIYPREDLYSIIYFVTKDSSVDNQVTERIGGEEIIKNKDKSFLKVIK